MSSNLHLIRKGASSLHKMYLEKAVPFAGVHDDIKLMTASNAFLVALLLFYLHRQYLRSQRRPTKPFPFLALPSELRLKVYEDLLEDPTYPLPPKPSTHDPPLARHTKNLIFLANKQIHTEYMHQMATKRTINLTVSPQTFSSQPPSSPTTALWPIPATTSPLFRKAHLNLTITPSMLGVSNPRRMKTGHCALTQQICASLTTSLPQLETASLHITAIPDHLWNPIWLWYHVSQMLKHAKRRDGGPLFSRITFAVNAGWSAGQHHMARDERRGGSWAWWDDEGRYMAGDTVVADEVVRERLEAGEYDVTVREFCMRIVE